MILPDHLHCIWMLPEGGDDFSTRWRQIKAAFSRQTPRNERRSKSRLSKGEGVSGSGGFVSMQYGIIWITGVTLITSVTMQSSTDVLWR